MTDDRLREAERVYQETGSPRDEARLLTERLRAGVLPEVRLELAATLGHEAALLALARPRTPRTHSLPRVLLALERFGREVVARAALAAARRTAANSGADREGAACLAAVEEWLACPCERHLALVAPWLESNVDPAEYLAAAVAAGRETLAELCQGLEQGRYATEPHSVLVAAVRRALVPWALGHTTPMRDPAPGKGTVLELTVGDPLVDATCRIVTAADKVRFFERRQTVIRFADMKSSQGCEVVKRDGGFEVRPLQKRTRSFVNDEPLARRRLASGDVVALERLWVEARVLDAPFDDDVERALREGPALLARGLDPARIAIAAGAGDLAATVAATEAGIPFLALVDPMTWIREHDPLPGDAAPRAGLRLAREVLPIAARTRPLAGPSEKAVAALARWLEATAERPRLDVLGFEKEIAPQVGRAGSPQSRTPHAAAATAIAWCMGSTNDARSLAGAVLAAADAGVPRERVRGLVAEEVARWALGS
ncbi:MAG TPA: hypothetical protein VFF73_22125 [Planctomycetota bacterium]|nr:hypothetical protein [Planctomycetota bacterium]